MIMTFAITGVMPCWGRPQRTRRMIECILAQTRTDYEVFVVGDGCPHFQAMIDSGEAKAFQDRARERGGVLHIWNENQHIGGYGQHILDMAIDRAQGKFFLFLANDDIVDADHFAHYLSDIEHSPFDMACYKTRILERYTRYPQLKACEIGHSEIIIRTEFLKRMPKVPPSGTHDWSLIQEIINHHGKIKMSLSERTTYHVRQLSGQADQPQSVDLDID
jgi:GT2 family glycosyltransferase